MNIWHDIDPARISESRFYAVVEIPLGYKLKWATIQWPALQSQLQLPSRRFRTNKIVG